MELNYDKWVETLETDEQDAEDIFYNILDTEIISEVQMGYEYNEAVAHGYFKNKAETTAMLYQYEGVYVIIITDSDREFEVYTEFEEAEDRMTELENSLEPSIETQLEIFKDEMNNTLVEIQVNQEFNKGGHFYSFDILYNDVVIEKGIFELDVEKIQDTIANLKTQEMEDK